MLSTITPNEIVAQMLAPPIMVILLMFGGFYLNIDSLWDGFKFIEVFSFVQYGNVALMLNEFEDRTFDNCTGQKSCLPTGDALLAQFGMADRYIGEEIAKLLALALGFRLVAWGCLEFLFLEKLQLKTSD